MWLIFALLVTTANQLADALEWEVNKVSAQLNRLQKMALVEKQPPAQGKRHLFQIGERFFNIWYLMRASRRVRRKLIWLVQFLRLFFSADELQQQAKQHLQLAPKHPRDAEYGLALSQAIDHSPLRHALKHQALGHLLSDNKTRLAIYELLDLKGEDAELLPTVTHMQALAEIREKVTQALDNKPLDFEVDQFCLMLLSPASLSLKEKRRVADKANQLSVWQFDQLFLNFQNEQRQLLERFGDVSQVFCQALASGEVKTSGDLEGAESAAEHRQYPELLAITFCYSSQNSDIPLLLAEQINNAFTLLLKHHQTATIYNYLGRLLQYHLQRYEEAETAYRKAIELDDTYAYPWNGLGNLLQIHLQYYEEAETAYRKAPSSWMILMLLRGTGWATCYKITCNAMKKLKRLIAKPSSWVILLLIRGTGWVICCKTTCNAMKKRKRLFVRQLQFNLIFLIHAIIWLGCYISNKKNCPKR